MPAGNWQPAPGENHATPQRNRSLAFARIHRCLHRPGPAAESLNTYDTPQKVSLVLDTLAGTYRIALACSFGSSLGWVSVAESVLYLSLANVPAQSSLEFDPTERSCVCFAYPYPVFRPTLLLVALLAGLSGRSLLGQAQNTGELSGTVVDAAHALLPGAQVTLISEDRGTTLKAHDQWLRRLCLQRRRGRRLHPARRRAGLFHVRGESREDRLRHPSAPRRHPRHRLGQHRRGRQRGPGCGRYPDRHARAGDRQPAG